MFDRVATYLVNQAGLSKSVATSFVYNWLGIILARSNAQAILAKRPIARIGRPEIERLVGDGVDSDHDFLIPVPRVASSAVRLERVAVDVAPGE